MVEAGGLHVAPSQRPAVNALVTALRGPQPPFVLLVSGAPPALSLNSRLASSLKYHQGIGCCLFKAYGLSSLRVDRWRAEAEGFEGYLNLPR